MLRRDFGLSEDGGPLELAQRMASHKSAFTTFIKASMLQYCTPPSKA